MNKISLMLFAVLILSCGRSKRETKTTSQNDSLPPSNKKLEVVNLNLIGDSGYIQKELGIKFLIIHGLTDTSGGMWYDVLNTDTIGKYYKTSNDQYMACFHDMGKEGDEGGWRTHVICEIIQNDSLTLLDNYQRYYHSMYPGCWEKHYDGFYKLNDYFCFDGCMTGSCFSGTRTIIFKNLRGFSNQSFIPTRLFECGDETNFRRVKSNMQISDTVLTIRYTEEIGKIIEKDTTTEYTTKKSSKFNMKFYLRNDDWVLKDSTNIKRLQM